VSLVVLAIGLVLVIEGLALALAPRRFEDALRLLLALSVGQRRMIGLGALGAGVLLVWLGRGG